MHRLPACLVLLLTALGAAEPVRFQWSVLCPEQGAKPVTAQVWIPPAAPRIRGVIIGSESYIACDLAIRVAAAEASLAIIRVRIDAIFDYADGTKPARLQAVLDAVAAATGFREIAVAPLFPFGHSVACNFASNVGYWNPSRTFGLLAHKGALVDPRVNPDASLDDVPVLAISGQFEEFGPGPSGVLRDWETRETGWLTSRQRYVAMRNAHPRWPILFAVDRGTTHMAWSPRCGELTAAFLRTAAKLRIPDWPVDATEPVACRQLDLEAGFLTSTTITNPSLLRSAPYGEYKGNTGDAWWVGEAELLAAWQEFHAGHFGKRTQFVAFADSEKGKPIYARHDLRYRFEPHWVAGDIFQLNGCFLDHARDRYAIPEPLLGHAEGPICFRLFNDERDAVLDGDRVKVLAYGGKGGSIGIIAYHPGDELYRYAEQPASVAFKSNDQGADNVIDFPDPGTLAAVGDPLLLRATSSSGLPVHLRVENGPAVIVDGALIARDLPAKSTIPLTVTVQAFQFGSMVEPRVKTAAPVTREIPVAR